MQSKFSKLLRIVSFEAENCPILESCSIGRDCQLFLLLSSEERACLFQNAVAIVKGSSRR